MRARYTEEAVVARVGRLNVRRLHRFVEAECVVPAQSEGGPAYSETDVARLELLCDLAEDFDLDEDALGLVMSLIDQLHGVRRELRALAEAIAAEPEDVRERIARAYGAREGG